MVLAEIVFTAFIVYFIYRLLSGSGSGSSKQAHYYLYIAMLLFGDSAFFLEMALVPQGAVLDRDNKSITLKYFPRRSKKIYVTDIAHYNEVELKGKGPSDFGIVIKRKNDKQILLSDQILDSYIDAQIFLDDMKIENKGMQPFNLISYYFSQWK